MATNFRRLLFWLTDFLKGGGVRKHYNEIKFVYYNYDKSRSILESNLRSMLEHAVRNVAYYRNFNCEDLSTFPIINKTIVRESIGNFIPQNTDRTKLRKVTTSGSTGAPFTVYMGKEKVNRQTADNIFFSELAGYVLGGKLFYSRVWNAVNNKSPLTRFVQNIEMIDSSRLNNANINELIDRIHKVKGSIHLLAFSSTLEIIAKHVSNVKAQASRSNVKSIIGMSESLSEGARKALEEFFKARVIMRYSNMENGFIAQQCFNYDEYHVNSASFFVEILNVENDSPVQDGDVGRIVVTDLFNYEMPLIRYDTGDLGSFLKSSSCNVHGPVLKSIEGRKVDYITDANGNLLSPHVITNTMWFFSEIEQFQFVQKEKGEYVIKINSSFKFTEEERMILMLKSYLGNNAKIAVEYVHEIPLLQSGKRKKIVNLMNQKV